MLKLNEALSYLEQKGISVSGQTLRNWARKYGLGHKLEKQWFFNKEKLNSLVSGKINYFDKFKKD